MENQFYKALVTDSGDVNDAYENLFNFKSMCILILDKGKRKEHRSAWSHVITKQKRTLLHMKFLEQRSISHFP